MNLFDPTLAATLDDNFPGVLFFGFCLAWIALSYGTKVVRTISRERTRREIAAYIAEGSMTPEQGERLLKAGGKGGDC